MTTEKAKTVLTNHEAIIDDLYAAYQAAESDIAGDYRPWTCNWSLPDNEPTCLETEQEAREELASWMHDLAEEWAKDDRFGPVAAGELHEAADDIEGERAEFVVLYGHRLEFVVLYGHRFWLERDTTGGLEGDDLAAYRALERFHDDYGVEPADVTPDDVLDAVQDLPLSVEYSSGWEGNPDSLTPRFFRIVLAAGGPHVELTNAETGTVRWLVRSGWGEPYTEEANSDAVAWFLDVLGVDPRACW